MRKRKNKIERRKFKVQTSFQKGKYIRLEDKEAEKDQNKPIYIIEKVTTNREIIKVRQLDSSENQEYNSPEKVQNHHESPDERRDLNYDLMNINQKYCNGVNTPQAQNLNDSENNVKEVKLFSHVDK